MTIEIYTAEIEWRMRMVSYKLVVHDVYAALVVKRKMTRRHPCETPKFGLSDFLLGVGYQNPEKRKRARQSREHSRLRINALADCALCSVSPSLHREKIEEATKRLFFFAATQKPLHQVSIKQMQGISIKSVKTRVYALSSSQGRP